MLVDIETLIVFVPIALALNLTPGADMLFCLSQGMKAGPRAGVAASFGIACGSFLHALAAGLGLAALIGAYPIAFEIIRWAGIAYLLWLAIDTFRHPPADLTARDFATSGAFAAWRDGVVVCLLNPKVAIFIVALVPQFVDPAHGSILLQFLVLGTVLNIGGTIINGLIGYYAGSIGQFLTRSRGLARALQIATSCVFVGLAARLAFDER